MFYKRLIERVEANILAHHNNLALLTNILSKDLFDAKVQINELKDEIAKLKAPPK